MLSEQVVRERFAADIAAAVRPPKPIKAKGWSHFDTVLLADAEARARFFDVLSDLVARVASTEG